MSALVQDNTAVDKSQAPAKAGGEGQASEFQINMGPHALALTAVLSMMGLYNEIIQFDQEQKADMVRAQSKETIGAANATRRAGEKARTAGWIAGSATAAGAFASGTITAYASGVGSAGAARTELAGHEKELEPMLKVQEMQKEVKLNPTDTTTTDKPADNINPNVEKLMKEFENGKYENALVSEEDTKSAINLLKMRSDRRELAEKNSSIQVENEDKEKFNFDNFTEELNRVTESKKKDIYSSEMKIQNNSLLANTLSTIINPLGGSVSTAAQGVGQAGQASENAKSTLLSTAQQMAGGSAGEFTQAAGKAESSEREAIQSLNTMDQNNGNQG